jgi:hypothetical protein
MGSETFSEFLIPLKFKADEASKKKFDAALAEVEKRFNAIGKAAGAAAVALAFAVKEISKNLANLAYSAERVGATSEEFKALGNAADRVGLSAETAKAGLSAFFAFVNFEGGASAIKQWFNVDIDPAHPLKAMLDSAVKLADEYASGSVPRRQTAIREAERAGIPQTYLTTPGAARRLREEMKGDEAFTGGALNPIAEKAKRLNSAFELVKQRLQEIAELTSGPLQDAFSDLLDKVNAWLKAHRDDIIWFSDKAAEIAKIAAAKNEEISGIYGNLVSRATAYTKQLWEQYDVTHKIHVALKAIGETLKSLGDGSITSKINAALEWAFQPFKWLWEKLQSLGIVGPGIGFGIGEGTEGGGHGAARRGKFGHPSTGGARQGLGAPESGRGGGGTNLGKEGWWTPDRQKHAYDRLRAGGLSDMGAKGLISRWVNVESTGGPASENAIGGGHFGIGQWSHARGDSIWGNTDFDTQLDLVVKESKSAAEAIAGKLLRDAKTPEEGARAATAYERAEHYERAGHGPHEDDWTAKTLRGIERVGKAIGEAGKVSATTPDIIPGQGDPHKPGFDPSSVKFHDYSLEKHSSRFPLGHQQFASNEHHDHRVLNSNIDVKVMGVSPIDRTAHPLERTKNATLIRNTTATAS